jgi:hypothetical protein
MPAPIQLATGLGGAIGCDYRSKVNRLFFVEFNGKVSCINLIPTASVVSSGTATIPGTYLFDFDTGTVSPTGTGIVPPYDVFWHQQTSTIRSMDPVNGARIVNLGIISFSSITHGELMGLSYGTAPIPANDDATNKLVNGDVFAVRTTSGNYAKVKVVSYGYNIQIQWVTYHINPRYQVLGTGYTQPEDIKVSADESRAYVTERSGNFLRVNLASANRAMATVVSSGMTAPQQIALDEEHNQAYLVEYANPGRLIRINLTTGAQTVLVSNLESAIGLLMSHDLQFAYVSEQAATGGRVSRIRLSTKNKEVLATGLTAPFFMTWTDEDETGILIAERDPANRVTRINLTQSPVTKSVVATVPFRPSSAAVMAGTQLLVCCDQEIDQVDLTGAAYVSTGPMLLGIGHVPVDKISRHSPVNAAIDGYADTTVDPGYFFQVKDAPFGGSLAIMFNHEHAYSDGARYYKLMVDGLEPRQNWGDYKWNHITNKFEFQAIAPSVSGYYRVRPPSELWYNHWMGYILDTSGLSNGLHTITVALYTSQTAVSEIGSTSDAGRSMVVQIDNTWPQVSIDEIWHDGVIVGTCAIVDSGTDAFTFRITASDPQQHLLSWSLAAWWGDNKAKSVDADSYSGHVSATKKWAGYNGMVPVVASSPWHATVAGDATSTRCAHTFYLGAWDRVINGWNYIHYADYHKSITLMLP